MKKLECHSCRASGWDTKHLLWVGSGVAMGATVYWGVSQIVLNLVFGFQVVKCMQRKYRTLGQCDKITYLHGLLIRTRINLWLHYSTEKDKLLSWTKNVILYHLYLESKKKWSQLNLFKKQKQTYRHRKQTYGYKGEGGGRDKLGVWD